jgi:hypothetical protein
MIANRLVSLAAATLITSAQWAVYFQPHLYIDSARLAAAAMVADASANASTSGLRVKGHAVASFENRSNPS